MGRGPTTRLDSELTDQNEQPETNKITTHLKISSRIGFPVTRSRKRQQKQKTCAAPDVKMVLLKAEIGSQPLREKKIQNRQEILKRKILKRLKFNFSKIICFFFFKFD